MCGGSSRLPPRLRRVNPPSGWWAFFSMERVVAVVCRHYTFIIIIHDLIMPNSDLKYYAVGVVPCNSHKKYQLLQTISCDHKIVYNGPHLFFPLGNGDLLPRCQKGDHLASGIVLAIFMD